MTAVGFDCALVESNHFEGISTQGGHGGGSLGKILGRLFDCAGEAIQGCECGLGVLGITERFGAAQCTVAGIVAGFLCGFVAFDRFGVFEGGLFEGARLSDVLLPLAQLLTYAVDAHAPNQRVAPLAYTTTACDHSFLERVIPRP